MTLDPYGLCPSCGESWDAGEIPLEHREFYNPPYRFSKLTGIEIRGKFDGVSEWMCPYCLVRWDRFSEEKLL